MTRPRGNKTSKATREQRRSAVVEVLKDCPNMTNRQLADETGVSLATLKRDLAALRDRFNSVTDARYEEFKQAQLAVFELIERNLVEGTVEPEVAREWRAIRSEISQLLGLNAEKRAIVAHVGSNQDATYMKFRKATSGLTDQQIEEVLRFADALPREKKPVVRDSSWFPTPEPKQLTEGVADDAS